ncbi:hypothetical protein AB0G00_32975 [Nocardia salmonicida]|uniref:hypothetical protein n=1 Tax=Nocardia salmonicida TaxID=53431 RepID=UPI0033C323C9
MPGGLPSFDLEPTLADGHQVGDHTSPVGAASSFRMPHQPTGAQPASQSSVDRFAAWIEQGQVDRFVGDSHRLGVVELTRSQPAICSGDQQAASFSSTSARKSGLFASLACFGRRAR